ncbi:MAG TPA: SdrD B-like domain-containing protein, partial [Humisphaera sp.]|nr:SdrD B-like domain-containing protein [Humisphaera sp.]
RGGAVAILSNTFFADFTDSQFDGNGATDRGGAVYGPANAQLEFINCAFVGNTAPNGAAVYDDTASTGTPQHETGVWDCTFAANQSTSAGSGTYQVGLPGLPQLENDILWGDSSENSTGYNVIYSDIAGGVLGEGNINADPQFLRAPSPGPDATWGTSDDDYGDLRLGKTSPALDCGLNIDTGTDILGQPRIVNVTIPPHGNIIGIPRSDMGAYERSDKVPPVADAGGSYSLFEGQTVALSSAASKGNITSYQWDFNYQFGQPFQVDSTSPSPTFSAVGLDGPATRTIALQVQDDTGAVETAYSSLTIANAAPVARFQGGTVTLGAAGSVSFSKIFDPSPADTAAGFQYSYDFNNDGTFEIADSTLSSATVPTGFLTTVGAHTINGRIQDKDGGFTDYTATVQVNAPALGAISGIIFNDHNANGASDTGEAGIAGRIVFIDKNKNGKLDTGEPSQSTAANGSYSFKSLAAGSYRIADVLPTGWRHTVPTVGYFDVTVAVGQVVTGKNFAETQNVLIAGTIYNDANGNAKRDSTEKGIAGRTVYIDKNKNGKLDVGEPSTVTASDGSYSFKTLAAGSYRVRQVLPAGSRSTSPTAGYYDLTLTSGQSAAAKDFADTTTALVSGIVFKDANSNAKQDAGELGLAGWVVYLDTNNNGKLDAGEKSFTTGADGKFSFVVPAGTYHLREVIKSGFTRTTPVRGLFTLTLASGQSATGKNFGNK